MSFESHSRLLRVYCAGPLFNQSERDEMTAIAERLCEAGYLVYLPHRDGMEFRTVHKVLVERGCNAARAGEVLHSAIFALDVYQLALECECMVWNLNGRTPDEGAVAEAAIAWTLGKPLVAYRDDIRTLIAGRNNPMLWGLVEFETVDSLEALPQALAREISGHDNPTATPVDLPPRLMQAVDRGRELWQTLDERQAGCDDHRIADVITDLFSSTEKSPT